jgi:N-carbamoyl-L-amino-acid hydrolase
MTARGCQNLAPRIILSDRRPNVPQWLCHLIFRIDQPASGHQRNRTRLKARTRAAHARLWRPRIGGSQAAGSKRAIYLIGPRSPAVFAALGRKRPIKPPAIDSIIGFSVCRARSYWCPLEPTASPGYTVLALNEERLLADLRALAEFGKVGSGVNRPAFGEADLAARHWLKAQMQAAGLDAVIDGIGNVYGRSPDATQSILVGSHSDSVPNGGWLDGSLGVIFGLEVARARGKLAGGVGIDVISFADEEGTWLPCLGSRTFCGDIGESALSGVQADGERLLDRLTQARLRDRPLLRLDPQRHRAYFEAHIEQGPRLDSENLNIGVVTGIVGVRRHVVRFNGRADHAGTTPMSLRRDAASAMFAFAIALADAFRANGGPHAVWNFGIVAVRPGAANVVPSAAELTVEFRDSSADVIERMEITFQEAVAAANGRFSVAVSSEQNAELEPAVMDPDLVDMLAEAAAENNASYLRMASGAGHDAMIMASRIPAAMMFVPSIEGRSHDVSENTSEADIRRGLRVFAAGLGKTLHRLASGPRSGLPRRNREAGS